MLRLTTEYVLPSNSPLSVEADESGSSVVGRGDWPSISSNIVRTLLIKAGEINGILILSIQ